MKTRTFARLASVATLIAALGGAWADGRAPADGAASASQGRPKVLRPGIAHYGRSYNELTGDWYNWVVQFPLATNPITENGTVDCSRGQKGAIWFIAGNFGGALGEANPADRSCTISPGKALFFPLANTLFWVPEDGDTLAAVRSAANAVINGIATLEVTIDGVAVEDLFAYRAQTQPGGFTLKLGPLLADFGYDPGPRKPAVADGYWVLLSPLRSGEHVIRFRSGAAGFALDVTYHLTVGGARHGADDD